LVLITALSLLSLGLSFSGAARAQNSANEQRSADNDVGARARALFDQGVELSRQGRWAEAESVFSASAQLVPSPTCLLNLAVTRYQLQKPVSGLDAIQRFEALHAESSTEQAARGRAIRTRLEQQVARRVLHVNPAHAELRVDGQVVANFKAPFTLQLDPGTHTVTLSAKGYLSSSHQIHADAGSAGELDVTLAPAPELAAKPPLEFNAPPRTEPLTVNPQSKREITNERSSVWKSPWLWVGVGVVAVSAGTTIFVLSRDTEQAPVKGSESVVIRL
jgi:hypothetical protein